jgi:hypothetical protein
MNQESRKAGKGTGWNACWPRLRFRGEKNFGAHSSRLPVFLIPSCFSAFLIHPYFNFFPLTTAKP